MATLCQIVRVIPFNRKTFVNFAIPIAKTPVITLTINGDSRQFPPPLSCADLITALGLAGKRVALERNGEIVPRARHAEQVLAEGDAIEIVAAVGGG